MGECTSLVEEPEGITVDTLPLLPVVFHFLNRR